MAHLNATIAPTVDRPIRIIQFGEGNFLRAFVDWQVQRANNAGVYNGNIAIVQPLASGRVAELEAQDRLYTVILEGLLGGEKIQTHEIIDSIGQTVNPYADWDAYLALADNPDAAVIISNTTEAGIAVSDDDTASTIPAISYPAKLTHLLHRRYTNGLPGFLLIPCELIENAGPALKAAVLELADRFGLGADFAAWVESDNTFASSLVDRIVPGYPRDQEATLWQQFGYEDTNMIKAEPFMLWVIEGPEWIADVLPLRQAGLNVVISPDLTPYHDRKVYLLNGPHTTMASLARLAGVETVGDVMADPELRAFIDAEMRDEIFPVIDLPTDELAEYAAQVAERFENPFVHHALNAIALNGISKFAARLLPVVQAHAAAGRPLPRRIVLALSGLLYTYAGRGGDNAAPIDSAAVIETFTAASAQPDYAARILRDTSLWGSDLTTIPGLLDAVTADLHALDAFGARAVIATITASV